MQTEFLRPTWVEVDLDAIRHNVKTYLELIPPTTELMAIVKANAYGHGVEWVAKTALEAGASSLGVAFMDEALLLRGAGIEVPILVLGHSAEEAVERAIEANIDITVHDSLTFETVMNVAGRTMRKASIHLKVDTGMGRLGFRDIEQVISCVKLADSHPYVQVKGMFTHLACADEEDKTHTDSQLNTFQQWMKAAESASSHPLIFHALNSAGVLQHSGMSLGLVRVGIGIYGLAPSPFLKSNRLKPALSFKTKIAQVKEVPPGATISYGATFTASHPTRVATLPVGYADGYNRLLSNKGEVLVHGQRAPVIGKVCMDQIMVDVTAIDGVASGDEVVLYGMQGEQEISVDEVAETLGTINYEVCCAINFRVPRVYLSNKEVVACVNQLIENIR